MNLATMSASSESTPALTDEEDQRQIAFVSSTPYAYVDDHSEEDEEDAVGRD